LAYLSVVRKTRKTKDSTLTATRQTIPTTPRTRIAELDNDKALSKGMSELMALWEPLATRSLIVDAE
jgi:hypothetical protein